MGLYWACFWLFVCSCCCFFGDPRKRGVLEADIYLKSSRA